MRNARKRRVLAATAATILMMGVTVGCQSTEESVTKTEEPTVTTQKDTATTATASTTAATTATKPTADETVFDLSQVTFAGDELVPVKDHIPDIEVELRYATENNFTGKVIYDFREAYLRYGTVQKLKGVQETLKEQGYGILIWDAYRPVEAQFVLWEVVPDPKYVANPNGGYSSHSNGGTMDISMIALNGSEVEMPSDFDEFDRIADRDYSDNTEAAATNARRLEIAMEAAGFSPYYSEWWHFSDTESYAYDDLKTVDFPSDGKRVYTLAADIDAKVAPYAGAETTATLGAGEDVTVIGYVGEYVHVLCGNVHGYIPVSVL